MEVKRYLAVDIGASSGRHIVGWQENGKIVTREVYRFPNAAQEEDGHLVWDTGRLLSEIKNGMRAAFKEFGAIESMSVDTWGVDYVLLNGDEPILPCYAYRDHRTEASIPKVHGIIPFDELYARTGCQFQPFNTVYQFYADKMAGRLDAATEFLMLPEYLLYRLSGGKKHEYTEASTMGMLDVKTGGYDMEIVRRLGLPENLFGEISQPGTELGTLLPEVAEEVGGTCRVVLCATHDTGSAVHGIPMEGDEIFLSSGTWSLIGAKLPTARTDEKSRLANYSNEGGVGYIRYLKNIMGLWLVQNLQKELCPDTDFVQIVQDAQRSDFDALVDANDASFFAPKSMKDAIGAYLSARGLPLPRDAAGYFRCAYRSLAEGYGGAVRELEENTGRTYHAIYIVGGGAKNAFLNELTRKATGKEIRALPIEATALGNLRIQMGSDPQRADAID